MADESGTAETEPTSTTEGGKTPDDDAAAIAAKANDPEAVQSALRSERAKAREAEKRAKAAEAKAKEYEDRDKTAQEKAEQRAKDAEDKAETANKRVLRMEVASSKKLPAKLADRLTGDTKEELEADADTLLGLVKEESTTDFDGGARRSAATAPNMNDAIRAAAGRS